MGDERRFYETPAEGPCRSAPAALRNREPIAQVLREWLPDTGLVLEIASGTGEHAVYFAGQFPKLEWQPSDIHPDALASIEARVAASGASNVRKPIEIDASKPNWPIDRAAAVLSINMVHISPWGSALGLLIEAARVLPEGAPLILYGPWMTDAIETAPSNVAFDADLKSRDPRWGLRKVEEFAVAAAERGLALEETRAMPANNLMLLLRRT
jgi:SAM-dependent methyltransferase